jgi:hypothetical protein
LNQIAVYILLEELSHSVPIRLGSVLIMHLSLYAPSIPSPPFIISCHVIKRRIPHSLVLARAAKATSSSYALLQLLNFDDLGRHDPLEHQLSNTVALLDLIIGICVVEEENLDGSAVVCVDDTSAGVDEVLGGEAGAGGNSAVYKVVVTWSANWILTKRIFLSLSTYKFRLAQQC